MTAIVLYTLCLILLILSFCKNRDKTKTALKKGWKSFEIIMPQFLGIIFAIGILLAIIKPSVVSKLIGSSSGFLGILISALVGSITIMPTFVAFSTGSTLLNNGAGYGPVAALISTLTLVGIVTLGLESKYIGKKAAVLRNFICFLFSLIVALFIGFIFNWLEGLK